jgi:uncharacterized membrane-anchored protein YjiN (DUF445 family)
MDAGSATSVSAAKSATTDGARAAELRRMKRLATGMLVVVALLWLLSASQGQTGLWGWVGAFAEAAMIGALADWFAVVALFRHPLGVPIPHTAILPRNKERVANTLAAFVRDRFLDTQSLRARIRKFDPLEHLAGWLQRPDNQDLLSRRLARVLSDAVGLLDDVRLKRALLDALHRRAEQVDLSLAAAQLLEALTEDQRHQALLDELLAKLALWLDDPDVQQSFAGIIVEVADTEYPTLVSMLGLIGVNPDDVGAKVSAAIVRGINHWLHEIGDDPRHDRRRAFDEAVREFIERLKHDPTFRQRVEKTKHDFLAHPVVRDYIDGLWDELIGWLYADLGRDDSRIRQKLGDAAGAFGQALQNDAALRHALEAQIDELVRRQAPRFRSGIAEHIASTVKGWDAEDLVNKIELSVGRDLQYIRMNGALVGGLIGVLIHAGSRFGGWL